MCQPSMTNHQ